MIIGKLPSDIFLKFVFNVSSIKNAEKSLNTWGCPVTCSPGNGSSCPIFDRDPSTSTCSFASLKKVKKTSRNIVVQGNNSSSSGGNPIHSVDLELVLNSLIVRYFNLNENKTIMISIEVTHCQVI